MNGNKSTGHLSSVLWEGEDLQIQTEIRYKPSGRLTTILVHSGAVLARIEKPWVAANRLAEDHTRVADYHTRLTMAIRRLCEKGWVEMKDLANLAERMVSVALRFTSSTVASEALALLPGAQWAAYAGMDGSMLEAAPAEDIVSAWCAMSRRLRALVDNASTLFNAGPLEDVSLKTGDTFVLMAPKEDGILLAAIEAEQAPAARQMMKRITERQE